MIAGALRHTFGTRLADRGVPRAKLQKLMRHASIQMTMDDYVLLNVYGLDVHGLDVHGLNVHGLNVHGLNVHGLDVELSLLSGIGSQARVRMRIGLSRCRCWWPECEVVPHVVYRCDGEVTARTDQGSATRVAAWSATGSS